ncbi:MAG: hypothetical protein LBI71_07045 [Enterobacteriaceae bacterium]|jgi:hypothetical protein|nr:hypothetical protein [Enterobacteriaceae bacterium]
MTNHILNDFFNYLITTGKIYPYALNTEFKLHLTLKVKWTDNLLANRKQRHTWDNYDINDLLMNLGFQPEKQIETCHWHGNIPKIYTLYSHSVDISLDIYRNHILPQLRLDTSKRVNQYRQFRIAVANYSERNNTFQRMNTPNTLTFNNTRNIRVYPLSIEEKKMKYDCINNIDKNRKK